MREQSPPEGMEGEERGGAEHERAIPEMLRDDRVGPFCREVAGMIGVTPERVAQVAHLSNRGGHVFHGVKDFRALDAVRRMGIHPVTPESRASHWTSGMALFGDPRGNNPVDRFFNATFFNYAHTAQGRPAGQEALMTIAMTRSDVLRSCDPQFTFRPNAELTVHAAIPREILHILSVRAPTGDSSLVQRRMFELLEGALLHGYPLGGETIEQLPGDARKVA